MLQVLLIGRCQAGSVLNAAEPHHCGYCCAQASMLPGAIVAHCMIPESKSCQDLMLEVMTLRTLNQHLLVTPKCIAAV